MSITADTCDHINRAVRLRVEGLTWNDVAQALHYADGESARNTLQTQHRAEWNAAYEEAREKYLNEIESEAVLTQRSLMRPYRKVTTHDGKVEIQALEASLNQSAAHSLLNHTRQLRAQKHEISGPGGAAIPLGLVLDASQIDNGRPNDTGDARKTN